MRRITTPTRILKQSVSSKMNDMNAAVNVRKNASGREPSKNQK